MSFERLLFAIDPAFDAEPVLGAAELVAPDAEEAHVLALLADESAAAARRGAGLPSIEGLQDRLRRWHPSPSVSDQPLAGTIETGFDAARIAEVVKRVRADLVVLGPWAARSPRERVLSMLELSSRAGVHVLSVGARCPAKPIAVAQVMLVIDERGVALAGAAAVLRELPGIERVSVLVPRIAEERRRELAMALAALLPRRTTELAVLEASITDVAVAVERAAAEKSAGLVVIASDGVSNLSATVTGLLAAQQLQDAGRPTLVLRRSAVTEPLLAERLVASDTLLIPGIAPRLVVDRVNALGRTTLAEEERFLLAGAEALGPIPHEAGVVVLPESIEPNGRPEVPLTMVSAGTLRELAPFRGLVANRPVLLIDATIPDATFADVAPLGRELLPIFVRLRAGTSLDAVRARLAAESPWVGPPSVIDASAWLDDSGAADVPPAVDAQRLLRLGLRLAALGAPIAAVLVASEHRPGSAAITTLTPRDCAERDPSGPAPLPSAIVRDRTLDREERLLRLATSAERVEGHQVELQLDNGEARRAVLAAIAGAKRRVHWQCYIVDEDPVAERVAAELRAAGERGLEVRVLVDALYSRHESFGTVNPVLERLARSRGVEVRAARPLSGVPSLAELKQRNHRKLVTIDGETAFIGGRNLGAPYYTGFDEVSLRTLSNYREIPWLDAGVGFAGPLVATLERSFLADWRRAGGGGFDVVPTAPAGASACRLILHEGLVDTHTLDLQLELIARARRRLLVVNTFPLLVELQRALVSAVRRGVRVQILFGSVRPRWGEDRPFEGGLVRALGDDLVRSRLDPVIRAGGEGYELAIPPREGWEKVLDRVFPHVHAKVMVRDEEEVAIGSANLDVTSAYWESEVVLLVHDPDFTRRTLDAFEPLLATARRVDLTAATWQRDAARRAWLGRNWPSIVG